MYHSKIWHWHFVTALSECEEPTFHSGICVWPELRYKKTYKRQQLQTKIIIHLVKR